MFCKWLPADQLERLQAEAEGLEALIPCAGALVVPRPLALGLAQGRALLVLDWLDLAGGDRDGWEGLGRGLAQLHRRSRELSAQPGLFGWHGDRWIGAGIQRGGWQRSWGTFFAQQRLADQFQRLEAHGVHFSQSERLLERLPQWLEQHQPDPCLVHGDLWPGNAGVLRDGRPCLYDPAVSYSDREVDLAMARMFGGLPEAFLRPTTTNGRCQQELSSGSLRTTSSISSTTPTCLAAPTSIRAAAALRRCYGCFEPQPRYS